MIRAHRFVTNGAVGPFRSGVVMKEIGVFLLLALWILAAGCEKKGGESAAENHAGEVDARPGMIPVPGETLARGPWRWVATVTPVERIAPPNPENYTIEFLPDSTARVMLDCNQGNGRYHVDGKSLTIGPIAATRMMCPPGTMDAEFGKQLDGVRNWFMQGDTLMMDIFADSGTMRFVQ